MLIKVLLVDDHDIVRMGVARMLADVKDLTVVGQVKTGEEAIDFVRRTQQPDVILMDVQMPGIGGVEATRKLVERFSRIKILAVSAHEEEPIPSRILGAGASGYITKGTCLDEMVKAIRLVAQGEQYFSNEIANQLARNWTNRDKASSSPFEALSRREMQMTEMIVDGKGNQDIADTMGVALTTLSTYRSRIYSKLNIDNDVKLTHLAMRFGVAKKE
jgi:two-component system, NarL family, invasion response regulator UvrY